MTTLPPTVPQVPDPIPRFVALLPTLDRGDRAVLRRNAGHTLAESRNALGLFYRLIPPTVAGRDDEELFFLVATLSALNDLPHTGNFGTTMRRVRAVNESVDRGMAMDRRMAILLDADFDRVDGGKPGGGELAFRLRQAVRLAASKNIGVDWRQLLLDLRGWMHPDKRVRKQWAQAYYGG